MLVRKGACVARALEPVAQADEIRATSPREVDLLMIETDQRQRVALTRELRAIGINLRPFATPRDFLDARAELRPGCVILNADAVRPGSAHHDDSASVLAQDWPTFITYDRLEVPELLQLVRLGAMDFLRKPFALHELYSVIERAAPAVRELRRLDELNEAKAVLEALSARERAVLDGLAEGLSSKALAHKLTLSPRTVEMHRGRIGRKLGVKSLAQLLNIAFAAEQAGGH